jgi:hypothetical protein
MYSSLLKLVVNLCRKFLQFDTKIMNFCVHFSMLYFFNLVSFHFHEMFGLFIKSEDGYKYCKYCNVMNAGYLKAVYYYIIPDNAM